jgi:hypothetical protein
MSCTEIVCFKQDGNAQEFSDVENAWLGAMAVWHTIEEKYLPIYRPSFVPDDIPLHEIEAWLGHKPSRTAGSYNEPKPIREIWRFFNNETISTNDKIVLGTTFDRMLVKKEDFERVIAAFESFDGVNNLKEQAEALREMSKDDSIIAAGWNQTSVTQNQWMRHGYDEENQTHKVYNCLSDSEHFWLFDDIN